MFAQYDVHEQATIQTTMKLDTALMSEVYSLADQYYEQMSSGESSILPIKQFLLRTQAITTALRDLYGEPCRDSDAVQEYFEQHPRVSLSQTLAQ